MQDFGKEVYEAGIYYSITYQYIYIYIYIYITALKKGSTSKSHWIYLFILEIIVFLGFSWSCRWFSAVSLLCYWGQIMNGYKDDAFCRVMLGNDDNIVGSSKQVHPCSFLEFFELIIHPCSLNFDSCVHLLGFKYVFLFFILVPIC